MNLKFFYNMNGTKMACMVMAALGVLILNVYVDVARVSGHSMNPTLHHGQLLLTSKHQNYQASDLIMVRPPVALQARASKFIKRLTALPGDTISIQRGQVYRNGQRLEEPYTTGKTTDSFPELLISKGEVVAFEGFAMAELPDYLKDTLEMLEPLPADIVKQSQDEMVSYIGSLKLNQGFYFVLGDNRNYGASEDSRIFGAISQKTLLAKALR
jgi:signal peptidase I